MVDRTIITETDSLYFNLFLRVSDLMEDGSKSWNVNLINNLFVPYIVG